jgi:hypothetical protein
METIRLDRKGLEGSRLCPGCMRHGAPGRGSHPLSIVPGAEERAVLGATSQPHPVVGFA